MTPLRTKVKSGKKRRGKHSSDAIPNNLLEHRKQRPSPKEARSGIQMTRDRKLLRQIALLLLRTELISETARALQSRLTLDRGLSKTAVTNALRDGICVPLKGQVRLANAVLEKLTRVQPFERKSRSTLKARRAPKPS